MVFMMEKEFAEVDEEHYKDLEQFIADLEETMKDWEVHMPEEWRQRE